MVQEHGDKRMILQLEEHLKVKVHDKGKGKWQPGLRTEIKEYTPLAETPN